MPYKILVFTRLTFLLTAIAVLAACGDTELQAQGGSLDLNPKLRADMQPSEDMVEGRDNFADGVCGGADSNHECRYVTQVLSSMLTARNGDFAGRLRKSDFLWVAGAGFASLSYEYVGEGVSVVNKDDQAEVFASNVTVGTCLGFPLRHPETRVLLPQLEDIDIVDMEDYMRQFDVTVEECSASAMGGISETLERVTSGCASWGVSAALNGNYPAPPENAPFCVVGMGLGSLMQDVSFSITPGAQSGFSLEELWPGVDVTPRNLLPNLKVVPVGGTRTISRSLQRFGAPTANDDGSTTQKFTFQVNVSGNKWAETFSPNISVSEARVRRGPLSATNEYLPIERFEAGTLRCATIVDNKRRVDVPACRATGVMFRTTPAYAFGTISQQTLTDSDRIVWAAYINIPEATLQDDDELFVEFDLTASLPAGSFASSLYAQPGSIHLGSLRTGLTASPQEGFTVNNYTVSSVWISSVSTVGGNAVEFGAPIVYRTSPGGGSTGAPINVPLILRGGSTFAIRLQPSFQSIGTKVTEVVVSYNDVAGSNASVRLGVEAWSVSPQVNLQPSNLVFVVQPRAGALGISGARRAAILSNDGPVIFDRIGFEFSGPDAANFLIHAAAYGSAVSDGSLPQTLNPGEAEIYHIGFYPTHFGDSSAALTVQTSEGDVSMQLHGFCEQSCEQPTVISIDPPRQLPPVERVNVIYPKIKGWTFGTQTRSGARSTSTDNLELRPADNDKDD